MRKNYGLVHSNDLENNLRNWIEMENKTHKWIANRLGIQHQTISKWARRFGIKTKRTGPRNGAGHPEWKGGRLKTKQGYIKIYCPGHPYATKPRKKYVFEHRLVMEKHIGRYVLPGEVVHHKNGIKNDNRIENLELYSCNAEHLREDLKGRCPKWTEDGIKRMKASWAKRTYTHLEKPIPKRTLDHYYTKLGISTEAVAVILGLNQKTVSRWMKKCGVQANQSPTQARLNYDGVLLILSNPKVLEIYEHQSQEFHGHLKKLLERFGHTPSKTDVLLWLQQSYPGSKRIQKMTIECL